MAALAAAMALPPAIVLSAVVLFPATAEAQSKDGSTTTTATPGDDSGDSSREDRVIDRSRALGDRIKSVQRRDFISANRHEIGADLGLTFNDAFYVNYAVDGHYAYHIFDSLALEARFQYFFAQSKLNSVRVVRVEQVATPDFSVASPLYDASLEAQFAPIYGKMSIMSETIIHYDLFVAGGFGFMATDNPKNQFHPAGTVAIGARVYATKWLAVRAEVRDQIYNDIRATTGDTQSALQNFLMFNMGVSIFLPFNFDYKYE